MRNLDISYRLRKIAERVKFRTVADVGTDHAYLPIFLCKNGKIDFAVASDINTKPLQRAKDNIKNYGLSEKINARLGSGLSTVSIGECQTLVMAGMGGMLTIELLNDNLKAARSFKQLILQPQHDLKEVRIFLVENGFTICDEEMLVDDGKFYNILDCIIGESEKYSIEEYYFGRPLIQKKDVILKSYISAEILKVTEILDSLYKLNERENVSRRIDELEEYAGLCKGVLECLQV